MRHTFRVRLYTQKNLSDTKTLDMLWRLLNEPIVSPQRYDSVERTKFPFRMDVINTAAHLYQEDGFLFVRGRRDGFLGVFASQTRGLATWDIWLDIRAMQGKKARPWLEWIFRLCSTLPILYGFGCSVAEYDAKHLNVRVTPGGGTATGEIGTSIAQFYRYLPGLYWLTIFGNELVQAFDQSNLNSLPGVEAFILNTGQIAILIDEPIVPENMDQRLQTESQLANVLGPTFFFDRNRTDLEFEAVPELIEVLNRSA
jgi:hypothetical protein